MNKKEDYLKNARECRGLARHMVSGEQRDQLLKMAETWEVLASQRDRRQRHTPDEEAPVPEKKSNGSP